MSQADGWRGAKLLSDAPADKDSLGAHQRIADALAELISSDRGGKSICLQGTWGSGKSTVIRLLAAKMRQSAATRIVIYDTWVHAGDPLRRAFLDAVIDAVSTGPSWLKDIDGRSAQELWEERRRLLSKTLQVTTKRTTPVLTLFGKVALGIALAVPLAVTPFHELAKDAIQRGFFSMETSRQLWMIATGVFALLPAFFILAVAALQRRGARWAIDIFSLVLSKSPNEQTVASTSSPEPTSIEFQEAFGDLLSNALAQTSRRLVVIIDNLDRLPSAEAQAVWSLLRSFLDNPKFSGTSWFDRLWLVVPLAKLPIGPNPTFRSDTTNVPSDTTNSYFEKLFQVRLSLPPPVLTDWRNLLAKLLNEAFPSIDSASIEQILRVANLYFRENETATGSPTPRELVLLVNDLVALALQWKQDVSLPHLAAFSLWSRGDLLRALRGNQVPNATLKRLLEDDDLRRVFAALYFNLDDRSKAHQLLSEPEILAALQHGTVSFIQEQSRVDQHLVDVLESVLVFWIQIWAESEHEAFFNSLIALDGLEIPIPSRIEHVLTKQCAQAIPHLTLVPFATGRPKHAFESLLRMAASDRVAEAICDLLFSLETFAPESVQRTFDNPDKWIPELMALVQNARLEPILRRRGKVRLPIDASAWVKLCVRLEETQSHPELGYSMPLDVMSGQLLDLVVSGEVGPALVTTVDVQRRLLAGQAKSDEFTTNIARNYANLVRAATGVEERVLSSASLILTRYSMLPGVQETTAELVLRGYLYSHFREASIPATKVLLLFAILSVRDDGGISQHVGHSQQGQAEFRQILANPEAQAVLVDAATALLKQQRWNWIYQRISAAGSPALALAKAMGRRERSLAELLLPEDFSALSSRPAAFIDSLIRPLADDESELQDYRLVILKSLCQRMPASNLLANLAEDDAWLLDMMLDLDLAGPCAVEAVRTVIGKFSTETWQRGIQSPGHIRNLAQKAIAFAITIDTGNQTLSEALLSTAHSRMDISPANDHESGTFARLLGPQALRSLSRAVYEDVASRTSPIAGNFWRDFGDLVKSALVELGARSNLTRRFVLPRLRQKDLASLQWLLSILEQIRYHQLDDDDASVTEAQLLIQNQVSEEDAWTIGARETLLQLTAKLQ